MKTKMTKWMSICMTGMLAVSMLAGCGGGYSGK